jgi:enamidase
MIHLLLAIAFQDSVTPALRPFVRTSAPMVALKNVRVIDGTGAPAREGQTIIIGRGEIIAIGDVATNPIPPIAEVLDLAGRTVMPGYVMVHEHMYYPSGGGTYPWHGWSFPRLYLAGGTTTIRTGGNMQGYADINLKRNIEAGLLPGPDIDATAPYLNGPGLPIAQVKALRNVEDAKVMVDYWAGEGATSFKAYMQISRAELGTAVTAAHARKLKVTGHLCSVTYREAADLGIDNLEHGFLASTDFVASKQPDRCPGNANQSLLDVDLNGAPFQDLVKHLVAKGVAITSTLTVFETFTPGRPRAPDRVLDAMIPEARDQYLRTFSTIAGNPQSPYAKLFPKAMAMELAFARAGGTLVVGTDPTGYGGVVAGFSNQRAVELLVEAGFTALEAIKIATLNGATYLGRADKIGSIAVGKRADLIVVNGNPAARISDVQKVEIVFKRGIGYDSEKLFAAVKGVVGQR